jgi:hypothetical protein
VAHLYSVLLQHHEQLKEIIFERVAVPTHCQEGFLLNNNVEKVIARLRAVDTKLMHPLVRDWFFFAMMELLISANNTMSSSSSTSSEKDSVRSLDTHTPLAYELYCSSVTECLLVAHLPRDNINIVLAFFAWLDDGVVLLRTSARSC